jgi:hypothetical protein
MNRFSEFAIGLLFGWGLLISGMTDPGKVIGFLDLAGTWDPSLAFVMGGGILVGLIGFTVAKKRTRSILGSAMHLPTSRDIDKRLLLGALLSMVMIYKARLPTGVTLLLILLILGLRLPVNWRWALGALLMLPVARSW